METIESTRVCFRPFEEKDAEAVFAYRSSDTVARYQYWQPYTQEDAIDFVRKYSMLELGMKGEWTGLAVIHRQEAKLIGDCALRIRNGIAEIGCNIAPEYQRQGFAKETLILLIEYCFAQEGIHEVYAITDSENTASIKLLESVGMIRDGGFEQRIHYKGFWATEYRYHITRK
ncbi:GNAT family N-acetyltransferase [uncultured Alistipes sp.]|jgi:acetyltransferase, GNAT family|uniref:GNAT family N-acetyltransferase n=1 Tax=uncultured Alistipes sp. TaxID=538949 RepID=UPI0025D47A39|nr:GNAT family N-acetyltransferase [uncultured Alistipes sp.]